VIGRIAAAAAVAAALALTSGCNSAGPESPAAAPAPGRPAPTSTTAAAAPTSSATPLPTAAPITTPPATRAAPHSTVAPADTAAAVDYGDPGSVASAYLTAWCRYEWQEPMAARAERAAPYLTPASAGVLTTDAAWWATVVATRTVAVCSTVAVYSAGGPDDATRRYLRLQATRQLATTGGMATEPVIDQRVLVLGGDGRWLVDARVQGG
jgi:hypothetical protein